MRKHYKVVSIPRFATFIILCTVLLLTTVYQIGGIYRANADTTNSNVFQSEQTDLYTEITVSNGDTLWSIAREYYGSQADKRKAVYEIQNLNHMTDTALYAGQIILLPKKL